MLWKPEIARSENETESKLSREKNELVILGNWLSAPG